MCRGYRSAVRCAFFPVDDSRPEHGTDCKQWEPQTTHTLINHQSFLSLQLAANPNNYTHLHTFGHTQTSEAFPSSHMHSVLPQKERAVQKGSAINAQIQAQQGWSMPFEVRRRMNVASHGALVCTFKASGKTPQTCHAN